MGTVIYEENGKLLKRFYGGTDRGVCYAVGGDGKVIEFTQAEFSSMITKWLRFIFKEVTGI